VVVLIGRGCGPLAKNALVKYDETTRTFGERTYVDMAEIFKDPKIRLQCGARHNPTWPFLAHQRANFGDHFEILRGKELGKNHFSRLVLDSGPRGCV
jgi:hypothetical protein